MTDPVSAIALGAAVALVGKMATDGWDATKALYARVLRRGQEDEQDASGILVRLERNAAQVAEADDPDRVRQMLVPGWQLELETLLREHPEVEAELREILARSGEPQGGQNWHMNVVAHDHGTSYGAMGGNVIHYTVNQTPGTPDAPGQDR